MNLTYKQVLDDFFTVISDHKMIKTAGYGPLSEIKVPRGTHDTNYPYAFLQPTNHTLGQHQMTYRFNLIMMEMCNDDIDSVITAQSDCLQYVKDILGRFYYSYPDYDFTVNFSVTPFKEVYDDTVSGVTATIELVTRDALDNCIAPFEPFIPIPPGPGSLVLQAATTVNYLIRPDISSDPLRWQNVTLDTFNGIRVDFPFNTYSINANGTWTFTLQGIVRRITDVAQWPDSINLFANTIQLDLEPTTTTWPVDADLNEDYPFISIWTGIPLGIGDGVLQWRCTDIPGVVEDQGLILPGCELKGFYIP